MDAMAYVLSKWGIAVDRTTRNPIEIPDTNREDLAVLFRELGFQAGVEVGVERGQYSEVLCRSNPGARLYCVDAWKAYKGYRDHVNQLKLDRFYTETTERLAPFKVSIVRGFSVDVAATRFEDGSLDFVYLDGNHSFENVAADLAAWSRKVRPGGIIAGHDFVRHRLLCRPGGRRHIRRGRA